MTTSSAAGRIGVLWRGDRGDRRPAGSRGLDPLFDAFGELPVEIVPLPFGDARRDEVRAELAGLDGLLVWVNPIQDGVNRQNVDDLIREASARGVFVSADPAVITKMGTKEVLYATRDLGWGSDTAIYRSPAEFAERFPVRLATHDRLVVKQGRGNGGDGVWKAEFGDAGTIARDSQVRVQNAQLRDGTSEHISLGEFLDRCGEYFAWSGFIIDQPFQERLADGMLRCYFSHGQVIGFSHQWPRGLQDFGPAGPPPEPPPSVKEGPDVPAYQSLRRQAEQEWVPQMANLLDLKLTALPVVWDADFLYGPKDAAGNDTFVLCEINVCAVWPFPPMGAPTVAANALARVKERRDG
jgi:hypothetical protein